MLPFGHVISFQTMGGEYVIFICADYKQMIFWLAFKLSVSFLVVEPLKKLAQFAQLRRVTTKPWPDKRFICLKISWKTFSLHAQTEASLSVKTVYETTLLPFPHVKTLQNTGTENALFIGSEFKTINSYLAFSCLWTFKM